LSGDTGAPITRLLERWRHGDAAAADALLPLVYEQLRAIARRALAAERPGHTFVPTELVHEAYLKLTGAELPDSKNRMHFFAIAANLMRQILVDHARRKHRLKRGGPQTDLPLDDALQVQVDGKDLSLADLDDALQRLEKMDPQQARIVELKYFGGLSIEETAKIVGISPATVKRDWNIARIWLFNELRN